MERAITYYEKVLNVKLDRNLIGPLDMAWFPDKQESYDSGGWVVHFPDAYKPSANGVLVYLTAQSGYLDNKLSIVEKSGGIVLQNKTQISKEHGFMAVLLDSEGNRIALHSRD